MLSTDKQTDKQTDRQTNQRYQKHNLLCQGGNNSSVCTIKGEITLKLFISSKKSDTKMHSETPVNRVSFAVGTDPCMVWCKTTLATSATVLMTVSKEKKKFL